ncbi:MAG: hypothetical protein KF878_13075 [Planctomycetes bacterium]|nr:hypothetical protein [Planctomycetota bacterium]
MLIAVVIAGGALALAAAGVSAAVRAEAHAGDLSLAATHLELLLGRVEAGVLPLSNAEGTFEEDGAADLRWSVVVTPGEREGLTDALLTVRWTRLGLERELSVSRLIYIEPETGR